MNNFSLDYAKKAYSQCG